VLLLLEERSRDGDAGGFDQAAEFVEGVFSGSVAVLGCDDGDKHGAFAADFEFSAFRFGQAGWSS
jgi:hypothetical protein